MNIFSNFITGSDYIVEICDIIICAGLVQGSSLRDKFGYWNQLRPIYELQVYND